MSKTWTTHNKKQIKLDEMDHQHLSNIYWYNILVLGYDPNNRADNKSIERQSLIFEQIDGRFNGEILSYKPLWSFKFEIQMLEKNGWVHWNKDKTHAEIKFNGSIGNRYNPPAFQVVGYIESPAWVRDQKLEGILNEK